MTFKIDLSRQYLKKYLPESEHTEMIDITVFDQEVQDFGDIYYLSKWFITINQDSYPRSVDEITTIIMDIPNMLKRCFILGQEYTIGFHDGGRYFNIKTISSETITIEACKSIIYYSKEKKERIERVEILTPATEVDRNTFVQEWLNFINTLVDLMVEDGLIARDEPSLLAYLASLPTIPK